MKRFLKMALVNYPQQKTGRRGRICSGQYIFFCPMPLVFMIGLVAPFLWWPVHELNWQCRQACQANKQSIHLDVYGLIT